MCALPGHKDSVLQLINLNMSDPLDPSINFSENEEGWIFNFSSDVSLEELMARMNMSGPQSYNILEHSVWRIFLISLFAVVILFGFLANMVVFLVIIANHQLHTVTNIFISTLAVSDIVICVFSLPFQLHYGIVGHWVFGSLMCHIMYPLFAIPVFVSTLTILMISIERFVLVVFPFKPRMTNRMAIAIVGCVILISICISLPVIIFTKLEKNEILQKSYCREQWPSQFGPRAYTMFVFAVQFFIPYISICVLYFKIYQVLKKRPLKKKDRRKNYRTTRILAAITVSFTISWLPFQMFSIILYFFKTKVLIGLGTAYFFTDLLLKIIAMSSACINPFFYGWLNDNFRKELGIMVGKKMKKLHMRRTGLTSTCHDDNEINSNMNSERVVRNTTTV